MAAQDKRAIAFTGFMGAGKSEAARAAAAVLGEEAVDVDEEISKRAGASINEIFEREGESAFRRIEEEVTLELLGRGGVLALGGGAVESAPVRSALVEHVAVWCRVDEEVAWRRTRGTGRPLAADREEFGARHASRHPLYENVSRAVLPEGGRRSGADAAPWLAALRAHPAIRLAWAASASGSYPAAVGNGALRLLEDETVRARLPARRFVVADQAALRAHRAVLPEHEALIEIRGDGPVKTMAEAERVLRELAIAGARRDDSVLAFGGGVVGDLAGFCASSYQRGVPLIQAPTTLVAQVDAAYGGKTGVDLPEAKNYVGAYHLPIAACADPTTLQTLRGAELAAGYAEVVKTGLIAGGRLWDQVRELESLDPGALEEIVFRCALTKLDVVAADERDSGRRAVLNLGHTVGHALEAATGYTRLRHGEAVGLGMLAALRLSGAAELRAEVEGLLARHELPTTLEGPLSIDDVIDSLGRDKKRTAEGVAFVLLERPGEPREGRLVADTDVRAAVAELVA